MHEADEDDGDSIRNLFSGYADHAVQAGHIHGGVHFNSTSDDEHDDRGPVIYIPRWAQVAVWGVLFLVSASYSVAIGQYEPTFWDWVKLSVSTLLILYAFVETEYQINGDFFGPLRFVFSIVVIALGVAKGVDFFGELGWPQTVGSWLLWRF
ncbi:hypothetical protein [Actinokineospora sp. NBRC 105648]|uniref:hypothetical protein n=1 Tax=Actinokineospora sp. NBRC 105648 TaxID=3032206 RepID=UPI00249FDF10|nr:hypothetical protein [Actinokineospora sp. NBRC 105648]GLZ42456.1 hypothetical protein Acsp05_60800 [Actinokineospora sp. NBRC 105648]